MIQSPSLPAQPRKRAGFSLLRKLQSVVKWRENPEQRNDRSTMMERRNKNMADQERLQAIEVALTNELREREFYLKHAERTSNDVGKAMFLQIADEELEHYERLKELHDKWAKDEKWPETVPLNVKSTDIKNVLVNMLQKVEDKPTSDTDDLDAIRTAIDFEFEAEKFYKKVRDQVTDPKEKEFFSLLCQIEREHALSLQDAEEYFTDPDAYFLKTERGGLDGV